jgi:mannosyltransferase OCH1-like enzyme
MFQLIHYLWEFCPGETSKIPVDTLTQNSGYIPEYQIQTPTTIMVLFSKLPWTQPFTRMISLDLPWIIWSDLGRLLCIYHYGGLYLDADCEIVTSFSNSVADDVMVVFTEKVCNSIDDLGRRECKNPENVVRVANYAFGSTKPHHPFLKLVILECLRRLTELIGQKHPNYLTQVDVLWVCGPDVITTIYHQYCKTHSDILLLPVGHLSHREAGSWRNLPTG